MLRHLFIDFDNTMMATEQHTLPPLIDRFNTLYGGQIDSPLTPVIFKAQFHGQAREVLCGSLGRFYGITVDTALLYADREWNMMQHLQAVPGGIAMAPNLIETLQGLAASGIHCAFVSNNPIQRALAAMRFADNQRGNELAALMGTRFFEAGEAQKPKPDVYLRAMQQTGATPGMSAAVEDSVTGATSAIDAGLATYGFTGCAEDPQSAGEKLLATGCRAVFYDWKDLPALLREGGFL